MICRVSIGCSFTFEAALLRGAFRAAFGMGLTSPCIARIGRVSPAGVFQRAARRFDASDEAGGRDSRSRSHRYADATARRFIWMPSSSESPIWRGPITASRSRPRRRASRLLGLRRDTAGRPCKRPKFRWPSRTARLYVRDGLRDE